MNFIAFRPRELQERGLSREEERAVQREVTSRLGWRALVAFVGTLAGGSGAMVALSAYGGAMPMAMRVVAGIFIGVVIMMAGRVVGRHYVSTLRRVLEERDSQAADARG